MGMCAANYKIFTQLFLIYFIRKFLIEMEISVKLCIIFILNFINLILFFQFNIANSESSEFSLIEFKEPEAEVSENLEKDVLEQFKVKGFRTKKKTSRSYKKSKSYTEEELIILEKELEVNLSKEIVNIVIMEFESSVFRSNYLFLTNYWQDLRSTFDNPKLVEGLVNSWQDVESKDLYLSLVSFFYKKNINRLKLLLYSSYDKKEKSKKELIGDFLANTDKLSCQNSRKSLAIIILIFQNKLNYIYSSYLLYIISCSYRDLSGMDFYERLDLIINNENSLGDKIVSIADVNISFLLKSLRKKLRISHNKLSYNSEIKIKHPLNMEKVEFETFGLNLCLSLLELSILINLEFELNYLVLLFGSRFTKPEEVLLARDIFKFITNSEKTISEITALLLFNEMTFNSLKLKIFSLHNVDISNLKNRFGECIDKITHYPEINGIKFSTDFQEKSFKRNTPRERYKNKIRSKYSFII